MDSGQDERSDSVPGEAVDEEMKGFPEEVQEEWVRRKDQRPVLIGVSPQDVPDGAQISKAFDTLCNIVRDRMRKYKKPEPIADFYTKGRYVLVTGDGSYPHPSFCSTTPSAGHVYVTIRDGMTLNRHTTPTPPPPPQPAVDPRTPTPSKPSNGKGGKEDDEGGKGKEDNGGKRKSQTPEPKAKDPSPVPPPGGPNSGPSDPAPAASGDKKRKDHPSGPTPKPAPRGASTSSSSTSSSGTSTSSGSYCPEAMSYEKLEVMESVEKFSNDRKVKGYEETSMVVETMIEKSSKKKH